MVKVVALTRPLAHAREHRISGVDLGHVVDQFLNQNRLAHAGAAEEADLSAARIGRQQVDHLDAGDEDQRVGRLIGKGRRGLVDRPPFSVGHGALFVDRLANHVDDAAQCAVAHRNRDRGAGVAHRGTAHQALGRVHRDAADGVLAKVLGDFQNQTLAVVVGLQRVQDRRQVAFELHVHDGADDLGHLAHSSLGGRFCHCHKPRFFGFGRPGRWAHGSGSATVRWHHATRRQRRPAR